MRLPPILFRLSRCFGMAALLCMLPAAHVFAQRSGDFGMTYTQERSKFVGSASSDYFYLRGATVDGSVDLFKGLGLSANATGIAATNLDGHIDIQHIQFMGGPRYTYNLGHITDTVWGRKGGIFVEGKVGYTFAIAGTYPSSSAISSTTAALTYYAGGGINVHLYHRLDWRFLEGGVVRTQLPNGGNNQQNTLRLASGINIHLGR